MSDLVVMTTFRTRAPLGILEVTHSFGVFEMSRRRSVLVLLYEGVHSLDVTGPAEALATVRDADGEPGYEIAFHSLDGRAVRAESGLCLQPDGPVHDALSADLLVVPGGRGVHDPDRLARLASWVRNAQERFGTIVSVCTGAFVLAEAGLLDGRRVATHWAHSRELRARYPRIQVDPDRLFVRDGRILTSGGVTAGVDLALHLIAEDFGHEASTEVARELVVFLRRSGSQKQFSAPLRLLAQASDRLAQVGLWMSNHLDEDLRVEALARRSHLSPRQFSRRFRESYGEPPASYVRRLRVDGARHLLEEGVGVQKVARAVGFETVDGLRRAFGRTLGVTPAAYRERFRRGVAGGVDS